MKTDFSVLVSNATHAAAAASGAAASASDAQKLLNPIQTVLTPGALIAATYAFHGLLSHGIQKTRAERAVVGSVLLSADAFAIWNLYRAFRYGPTVDAHIIGSLLGGITMFSADLGLFSAKAPRLLSSPSTKSSLKHQSNGLQSEVRNGDSSLPNGKHTVDDTRRRSRRGLPIASSWSEFCDGVALTLSPRLVGTDQQIKNIPDDPVAASGDRGAFIRHRLRRIVRNILIIAVWTIPSDFLPSVDSNKRALQFDKFFGGPFKPLDRIIMVIAWFVRGSRFLEMQHDALALFSVATGLSETRMWPSFFGSFADCYTVRKMWGSTWHQAFRRPFTTFGDFIALDVLGLPSSRSDRTTFVRRLVAFALSAYLHSVGDWLVYRGKFWYSWKFFLAQIIPMTIEDFVIRYGIRALGEERVKKHKTALRTLGYLWVLTWFSMTMPALRQGNLLWAYHKETAHPMNYWEKLPAVSI